MRGRLAILLFLAAVPALPLDPQKSLTQYSRTTWTQMQGLPQDTIRAIAQTADGYLWLGTDEGLARFDGYEFTTFQKANGNSRRTPSRRSPPRPTAGSGSARPTGWSSIATNNFGPTRRRTGWRTSRFRSSMWIGRAFCGWSPEST